MKVTSVVPSTTNHFLISNNKITHSYKKKTMIRENSSLNFFRALNLSLSSQRKGHHCEWSNFRFYVMCAEVVKYNVCFSSLNYNKLYYHNGIVFSN